MADIQIVNDLPLAYEDTVADRLDANFRTYFLQEKGNAIVNVEKWTAKKVDYQPSKLGKARGRPHLNQYLIKEDSFTDIGGGRMTFLRHFAQIPEPWFDFEQKSVLYYHNPSLVGINFDSKYGRYGWLNDTDSLKNVPFIAKATRYYVTKTTMDFYLATRYSLIGDFDNNWLYPHALIDNTFLTNASTGYKYPAKLFVNNPRVLLGSADATPVALAPDKVTLWKPNIYEITRYESSINYRVLLESEAYGVAITFRWIAGANFDEESVYDNGTLRVDYGREGATTFGNTFNSQFGAKKNQLRFQQSLRSSVEKEQFNNFRIRVQSQTGLKVVDTLLGGAEFENPLDQESDDQTFALKWDGESAQINLTFVIGK